MRVSLQRGCSGRERSCLVHVGTLLITSSRAFRVTGAIVWSRKEAGLHPGCPHLVVNSWTKHHEYRKEHVPFSSTTPAGRHMFFRSPLPSEPRCKLTSSFHPTLRCVPHQPQHLLCSQALTWPTAPGRLFSSRYHTPISSGIAGAEKPWRIPTLSGELGTKVPLSEAPVAHYFCASSNPSGDTTKPGGRERGNHLRGGPRRTRA